jgi:glucokinase
MTAPVYASVDLGGTNVACLLARADGVALAEGTIPTRSYEGPEAVLARIGELIERLAAEARVRLAAIGVGVPGQADLRAGTTKFLPNLPTQWRDVPVRATLAPRLGCPVYLLNDVRMAALGERAYGLGREVKSFVLYAVGTGVGGGVVLDGRLVLGNLRGADGSVGEIGHMSVDPFGRPCSCGSRGCVELFFSGPALTAEGVRLLLAGNAPVLHELTGGDVAKVTVKTMAEAARRGDERVRASLAWAAERLGIGVAAVVTTLAPELVVFAGGLSALGELVLAPVRATVRARVGMFPTDALRIEISPLGDRAGALGGIALAAAGGLLDQLG